MGAGVRAERRTRPGLVPEKNFSEKAGYVRCRCFFLRMKAFVACRVR